MRPIGDNSVRPESLSDLWTLTQNGFASSAPSLFLSLLLSMQDLIAKATTLLEALPYIQEFNGATFVIKYGGSFMDSTDPNVRDGVARDIVFLESREINPVVVHGGGKAISRAMERAGLKANSSRDSELPTRRPLK